MRTPEPPPEAPRTPPARVDVDAGASDRARWDAIANGLLDVPRASVASLATTVEVVAEDSRAIKLERQAVARELAAMRRYVAELETEAAATAERARRLERERDEARAEASAGDALAVERAREQMIELQARERDARDREMALMERERAAEATEARAEATRRREERLDERERAMRRAREDIDSRDDELTQALVQMDRESDAVRREMETLERRRSEIVEELTEREVEVLRREESVTEREHELRIVEGRLDSLKERAADEEARVRRAMERADAAEKRESDVARRLAEIENDEQRARSNLRETQNDLTRAIESRASVQREVDSLKKDVESLRDEADAFASEKGRQLKLMDSVRADLDDRERETADAAEIAAKECEAIAVAWDEVETMRGDLERQEKMIEETAARLEDNVKAFDRDVTAMREREETHEHKQRELREHEEFLDRMARENETRARDLSAREAELDARRREAESREAEIAEWKPQIEEFRSKRTEFEAQMALVETAKTELEETRARERELDEKEAQLERREEAAARQLSAAAEAEVILNEENAKLEQKLHELAPNLLAAELEREIVDLKMELERAKATANAALANADVERRRREEEASQRFDVDPFAPGAGKDDHDDDGREDDAHREERARAEELLETKTAALLRANALLDARENELATREFALSDDLERLESDTTRMMALRDEIDDKLRAVAASESHRDERGDDDDARATTTTLAEAERVRSVARAHLEAALANAEAARAINDACEKREKESAAAIERVSSIVASTVRASRAAAVSADERESKMELLDAQLAYVAEAKSELDRREASARGDAFVRASRDRSLAVDSARDLSRASRLRALRGEITDARAHLDECLETAASDLNHVATTIAAPTDVDALRASLARLRVSASRLDADREDDRRADREDILARRLRALEREIRRAGAWFDRLRSFIRSAIDRDAVGAQ